MKILITGSAGFIGSTLAMKLLDRGDSVIGIDNFNDYYDPSIKHNRIKRLENSSNFININADISSKKSLENVFEEFLPDVVVNLAAQAGVRYSIENPMAYIESNIVGFANILEASRNYNIKHLVYASSSSVYGANTNMPFSIHNNVDHPLSLYAASKKSNELMAHSYSHLFSLPTTGLRFFTVYGPWGRPDMALFKFTKSIIEDKPIDVFNFGKHRRDFTYIDDIVEGVMRVIDNPATANKEWNGDHPDPGSSSAPWKVYNIGNNKPIELMSYIAAIEKFLNKKAEINFLPLQPGDVPDTYADVTDLVNDFGYQPSTSIEEGVANFVEWYLDYYKK